MVLSNTKQQRPSFVQRCRFLKFIVIQPRFDEIQTLHEVRQDVERDTPSFVRNCTTENKSTGSFTHSVSSHLGNVFHTGMRSRKWWGMFVSASEVTARQTALELDNDGVSNYVINRVFYACIVLKKELSTLSIFCTSWGMFWHCEMRKLNHSMS